MPSEKRWGRRVEAAGIEPSYEPLESSEEKEPDD
jgi:hypothetical protein